MLLAVAAAAADNDNDNNDGGGGDQNTISRVYCFTQVVRRLDNTMFSGQKR